MNRNHEKITEKPKSPVLALDVGDKRIGVAVSESLLISSPIEPIFREIGKKATLNSIEQLVVRYKIGLCVIGLPLLESGEEGEQVEKTRAFARSLERRLPNIAITFFDERYSSASAKEILAGRTVPAGRLDSIAAAVFLQEFLDQF